MEERFKARLVARGFSQRGGDYEETFSPVVRSETIRAVLAQANQENLHIEQMDVTTAFLNGKLEEEVYMRQPEGREVKGSEEKVCQLHRSIYGLKQAPRCWNSVLDKCLRGLGFSQAACDPCLYISEGEKPVILAVYVDDLILTGESIEKLGNVKMELKSKFKMKDLGELREFLGMEVARDRTRGRLWMGAEEVCGSDTREVWNVRVKGCEYTRSMWE